METYISGPGFASCFNLRNNKDFDSHQIIDGSKKNDNSCKEAIIKYVDHLARGLSIVCNIIDPDVVVLGGGMSNIDFIYQNIDEAMKRYVFSDTFHTKILKNKHGDSGGVRGAAWLA